MKHFLIYTNRHKDANLATTKRICDHLALRGQRVTVKADEDNWKDRIADDTDDIPADIPADVDCMIVLGGDGTVLQAARATKKLHIPIIGVNLGTLGYMTEIEPENLEESIDRLISGDYEQESRMMLNGKAHLSDGTKEGWALNDIVISRCGSLQIIKFNIYVNGQFLNDYQADGMIVTTPTGSTGYNLSAGGPLVEPKARLIVLTPICPHSLNQRSIILSPEDCIEIEIPEGREGRVQTVEANFDGTHVIPLCTGDRIRIVQSEKQTDFIKLNQVSFLEVLHRKMSD
jgi:NAD+ kinase